MSQIELVARLRRQIEAVRLLQADDSTWPMTDDPERECPVLASAKMLDAQPADHERLCDLLTRLRDQILELQRDLLQSVHNVHDDCLVTKRVETADHTCIDGVCSWIVPRHFNADDLDRAMAALGRLAARLQAGECPAIVVSDDGETATINGARHRLSSLADAVFLRLLLNNRGKPVKGTAITRAIDARADRVFRRLPKAIKAAIDAPGKGRSGYMLR